MKNKKTIFAIIAILLIAVVGVTLAYFQSNSTFENLFATGTYRVVTTEVFESPDNWAPAEEIEKKIITKNEGSIPAAVRVSYTEQWLDGDTDITSNVPNGTVSINLDNTDEWTKEGNYYYYNYILEPGAKTSSFIKSVTLNDDLNGVTCTPSQNGLTQTCQSDSLIIGATYKLTITKETVQADKYKDLWQTNIDLTTDYSIVKILSGTKGDLQPGDIVGIGDTEDFYVISSDNSEGGKTILLARHSLKVGDIEDDWYSVYTYSPNDPGYGLQDIGLICEYDNSDCSGVVRFSNNEYWMNNDELVSQYTDNDTIYWDENNYTFKRIITDERVKPYVYDSNSLVYQYISGQDGYVNRLKEMGAPATITGRLLSYEEAYSVKDVEVDGTSIILGDQSYWLGSACDKNDIWSVNPGYFLENFHSSGRGNQVRPVIEVLTEDIR